MKRKMMAMLLACTMIFSLTGCGGGSDTSGSDTPSSTEQDAAGDTTDDATDDTTSDATDDTTSDTTAVTDMRVAMITDSGDITDQSFNQTTYEACKAWSESNGVDFSYFKPESDSDESRSASVDQASAEGYNVIVMPGYMFATAIIEQAEMYPDTKFIGIDVGVGDILEKGVGADYDYVEDNWNVEEYYHKDNVYCCTYQEEISGYMAGYVAVKMGYKHLGFLGGMSVPAVMRYGYGYVQGIDAAAKELGIENEVEVEYVYGGQFYGDADITATMDTWYGTNNVEVVFACGGGIFTSAAEAAQKVNGKVIGVDSDQAATIDAYGEGMTITSAMKGLTPTVTNLLDEIKAGNWANYAGKIEKLGMISENPDENYVQLPTESTVWNDGCSEEDYHELVKSIFSGEIEISNDVSTEPEVAVKVTYSPSIK